MAQEVSSEDGVLHVRNDERPSEGSTEAQVQAEGVHTISRNGRLVSSLQGPVEGEVQLLREGGMTLTSAPVSTRKRKRLVLSMMKNR